jgi:CopA family copper-resistance protein
MKTDEAQSAHRIIKMDRRTLLKRAAVLGGGAALGALLPPWAQSVAQGMPSTMPTLSGEDIKLIIGHTLITIDGKTSHAVTINGTVPGPLLRLKEGQRVKISVTNNLHEESSIHWHGLLVPTHMDGVPGVSFPGIPPGETFVYEFPVVQSGTYWYHSHSGLQEAEGHYAPIVIDPADADPVKSDREHVIVLADHSEMHPHLIFKRMKQQGGVFNYQRQTIAGLLAGEDQTFAERAEWAKMLMDPTDISDVTGAVMTFLVNGHGPKDNSGLETHRRGSRRTECAPRRSRRIPDWQRRDVRHSGATCRRACVHDCCRGSGSLRNGPRDSGAAARHDGSCASIA